MRTIQRDWEAGGHSQSQLRNKFQYRNGAEPHSLKSVSLSLSY